VLARLLFSWRVPKRTRQPQAGASHSATAGHRDRAYAGTARRLPFGPIHEHLRMMTSSSSSQRPRAIVSAARGGEVFFLGRKSSRVALSGAASCSWCSSSHAACRAPVSTSAATRRLSSRMTNRNSSSELSDDESRNIIDAATNASLSLCLSAACCRLPCLHAKPMEVGASIGGVGVAAGEQQLQHKRSWA